MNDTELIKKIRLLKHIQPRHDWVILAKRQILGEEPSRERFSFADLFILRWKPAMVVPTLMAMVIFGLTFTLARSSVPGDFLYPVKKVTETAQVNLSVEKEKPKVHLEIANKRLEDLDRIANGNMVGNLAPAIKEFQSSVSEAAKGLAVLEANTSSDPFLIQEIAKETHQLEANKKKVEALGIVLGETVELDSALAKLVEREVADLEGRTLNEKQWMSLEKAKKEYLAGNYSSALEEILLINNY